jgi:lycopene cyclase domain-containing protein
MFKPKTIRDTLFPGTWFLLTSIITLALRLSFTVYIILFTLPVIIFLIYKINDKALTKKIVIFCASVTTSFVFTIDLIAHITKAWVIKGTTAIQFLNISTIIDNYIWGFCYVFLMILAYEYYFDQDKTPEIRKSFKTFIVITTLISTTIFFSTFLINYENFQYFYFTHIITIIIPTVVYLIIKPTLRKKILFFATITLIPSLLYDYVSIKLDHWRFLQSYIFNISIGGYKYPIEELLWQFFMIPFTLLIYEIVADNNA